MHRFFMVLGVSFVCIFCCVWQHVQWIQMGRVLTQKEETLKDLHFQVRALQLKEASLSSLERIETISCNELGLIRGRQTKVVYKVESQVKHELAEHLQSQGIDVPIPPMPSFMTFADAGHGDQRSGRSA